MKIKSLFLSVLALTSTVLAKDCLKAKRKGNWDGKEVVEINIPKGELCKIAAYELCTPMLVELLEISNVPKKNYMFDFGVNGLESDGTLFRESISSEVEGNVQFYQIDFQTIYKNAVVLFGFEKTLCRNENENALDKIKVRIYGRLDTTDDPSTVFQPEEAISLEDPKIKMVQKDCFDNVLSYPFLFSQKEDDREFLYDDLLQLRDDDIINTEAFKKLNELTQEFGKNQDTTCRNWLYILALSKCYEAQQGLPEEFIFDEMPVEVLKLFSGMDETKLSKRLTMCKHAMNPRKLDIEKKVEEEFLKKEEEEKRKKQEL